METFTPEEREEVLISFLPRIKSWVIKMSANLPSSVEQQELYSAASLGLMESMARFDKSKGASFYAYAEKRVKGAMIDALRNMDVLPRNVRTRLKSVERQIEELAFQLNRTPTYEEVAQHYGTDLNEIYKLMDMKDKAITSSLEDSISASSDTMLKDFIKSNDISPEDSALKGDLINKISKEVATLGEKEQLVLSLYYVEDLTMSEVAAVLEVTESRVSQIHSKAVSRLRKRLVLD